MNVMSKISRFPVKWLHIIQTLCILFVFCVDIQAASTRQFNKVTLSLDNVEIREVLKAIKSQTGLGFLYNAERVNDRRLVSVNVRDVDVNTALEHCFKGLDVDCLIQDRIIIIQDKVGRPDRQVKLKTLKGMVTDEDGRPLPGVAVRLKGTAIGVATDQEGRFSLALPETYAQPVLLFSFVGMTTVECKAVPGKEVRIVLKEDSKALDEVVVTGMEVIKKEHMTGSASVITAKDLKMQGITSIDRILDGLVAGLNSTAVSGAPGTRSRITIRGENNLSGNTEPLWIVDGLPMMSGVPKNTSGDYAGTIMQDGVGNIMPEDIESISILKDASAAAIYGARAANGVIVITTKKGFRSKTQINYSGSYEFSIAPSNNLEFMNSAEKLEYERSIIDHYGYGVMDAAGRTGFLLKRKMNGYLSEKAFDREIDRLRSVNTDWFDVLFRTAQSHRHNVSMRGGNEDLTYYTSINYQQKDGILFSNKYQSAGLLLKLDYRPIDKLIIALNVSVNTRKNRDHASGQDPFRYAMFANTYERPFDENGNYDSDLTFLTNNFSSETASGYVYDRFNIVKELTETRNTQEGLDASLTLDLRYEIIPGLTVESIIRKGSSYNSGLREINEGTYASWLNERFGRAAYKDATIMPDRYDNGELSESSGRNHNWSIRNQIDYSFNIRKDHLFSILLANEVVSKKFNNFGYSSPMYNSEYRITGVPEFNKDVSYEDLKYVIANMFHTTLGQDRSVSFLGSLRYGYKDRYVANFSYRADGADVIGNTNRFTPLWSMGLRYNLHKEKFFQNNVVSELALRASFGYTGNIDRSALPFSTITIGSNSYMGENYATRFTYPNPTVKWEKKKSRNLGLDLGLFKGRINLGMEYYSNRTDDILERVEVPVSTGRSGGSVRLNGGIVENSGFEMNLNVKWIQTPDLTFSSSFNIARNKNVIKKCRHNMDSYRELISHRSLKGGIININGKETGSIYGWKTDGVNPKTGRPRYMLTEAGKRAYSSMLDEWEFASSYNRGKYQKIITDFNSIPESVDFIKSDPNSLPCFMPSMQYLGRTNPKYVGGFNTVLRYKGLEFSTNWTFKVGHLIPSFNDYQNAPHHLAGDYSSDFAVSPTNREKKYLYYWKAPGDLTDVSTFVDSFDYWAGYCKSSDYSKGDYLRMTNLALSYRLPKEFANKLGLTTCMIGFNARNLLTFTKYKGLDVGSCNSFSYPVSRDFSFKLSIGF